MYTFLFGWVFRIRIRILERRYHFVEGTEKDEILHKVVNNFTLRNPQQLASYGPYSIPPARRLAV